jgi:hypothetical protein
VLARQSDDELRQMAAATSSTTAAGKSCLFSQLLS